MRVVVDESRCQAHGVCAMTAPELFDIEDDDEIVRVLRGIESAEDEASARRALANCPERALSLVDGAAS